MQEDLEAQAKKEAGRIDEIMAELEVLDEKSGSLVNVLKSYHADCRSFLERGKFLQALEAAFICWAYVDAGLHLGVFRMPNHMRSLFTVGD